MSAFALERLDALAACVLEAIARTEVAGVRPQRLTEPGQATWRQFATSLSLADLLALVAEDAAVRYPVPCDPRAVLGPTSPGFERVPGTRVHEALQGLGSADAPDAPLGASTRDILTRWAKRLTVPHRFAGADLRKVQPGSQVLELPGTGGQLAARALEQSEGAFLHTNVTIATEDWNDLALAGLVAMELQTPHTRFIRPDPDLALATSPGERERFDLVFGLQPAKGGRFDAETLTARFPTAAIVLV